MGVDNTYSKEVAEKTVKQFVTDNRVLMSKARLGDYHGIYMADDKEMVKLFGRHQIQTTCLKECREFRFGKKATNLTEGLAQTWKYLKYICWFAGVWSAVALVWIIIVVFMRRTAT